MDDDVRRTVEFHKDPYDIDEVLDHVMYCCETGWQPKTTDEKQQQYVQAPKAEPDDSDKETSSSDNDGSNLSH